MSKYTTGELAKICDISIRTVQFYDKKGLLHPSELTDGGRRLYTDADVKQMQFICVLKSLGLSLEAIKGVLESSHPVKILRMLLDEQEKHLKAEMNDAKEQMALLDATRQSLMDKTVLPENFKKDIDTIMVKAKTNKLRSVHLKMLFWGSLCTISEIASILIWIFVGTWIPFAVVMPPVIVICVLLTRMYYYNTMYICPECDAVFRPLFKEFFFSSHTPKTRKLSCKHCNKKVWCVESYGKE